ncbi:MAG: DUF917 domain-containing protein [Candidatus Bathyarchaeia archaeon]|nr:DUF917 domain-containing protein [Candidatus Bathyarchaeota archaeon]
MRVLSEQDLEDLLVGAKILGAGGGGEVEWAKPLIDEAFENGWKFRIIDIAEIPREEMIAIVGAVGGGVEEEIKKKVDGLPRLRERPEISAENLLSNFLKRRPYALVPSEIGPGNIILPLYVAAATERCVVDGDCCGRAKPEIAISTTNVMKLPITPLAIATQFGDNMILTKTVDDFRAEDICRFMAIASGGLCGVARCPNKARDYEKALVRGSISESIRIGSEVRKALSRGGDPVSALIEASSGYRLFTGEVKFFERQERGGFMWGTVNLKGVGGDEAHTLKIWFKNEYLISWLDGEPFVTCPDTICIVDAEKGYGLSCWGDDFKSNRRVVVIGRQSHKIWRTEDGVRIFGPRHFGFDIQYKPIEDVVKKV